MEKIYNVSVWLDSNGRWVTETTDSIGTYSGEGNTINEAIYRMFQHLPISVVGRTFTFESK